jgi:hypothetical protein
MQFGKKDCGQFGGEGEIKPWDASIYFDDGKKLNFVSSGTLVSKNIVLTSDDLMRAFEQENGLRVYMAPGSLWVTMDTLKNGLAIKVLETLVLV